MRLAGTRNEIVLREPAPRRQVLDDRRFLRTDFQQSAVLQGVDVLADQEQQTVPAVERSAVERDVGRPGMAIDVFHQNETDEAPSERNSTSRAPPTIVAPATSFV